MAKRLSLALLLLVGCNMGPQPDMTMLDGRIEVFYNGHPPVNEQVRHVIETFDRFAREEAAKANRKSEWKIAWRGDIEFRNYPFRCESDPLGDADYTGCQAYPNIFEVGYLPNVGNTALIDEVAHLLWETLYGLTGEDYVGGKVKYDVDYNAFVTKVRSAL